MSDRSTVLLEHHLKELKLPTFLREYGKVAGQCEELLVSSQCKKANRFDSFLSQILQSAPLPSIANLFQGMPVRVTSIGGYYKGIEEPLRLPFQIVSNLLAPFTFKPSLNHLRQCSVLVYVPGVVNP